jgi:hypothetical protein
VETRGQLLYEWRHLKKKLSARSPHVLSKIEKDPAPRPHPVFRIVPGPVRKWEKQPADPGGAAPGAAR